MKTIAVDLDDTLNDFTQTLQGTAFPHHPAYNLPPETFDKYLEMVRSGVPDANELLSTEYSYFYFKIHLECYKLAAARPDAVAFMQWLRANEWRIVICTHRDLRRSNDCTRKWLQDNGIPFDYLFMALNKLEFCKAWGIRYLIDDHLFNLSQGDRYDTQIFYPIMSKHAQFAPLHGRGFGNFEELKQWIPG
jgi:hypothetical protein